MVYDGQTKVWKYILSDFNRITIQSLLMSVVGEQTFDKCSAGIIDFSFSEPEKESFGGSENLSHA